MSDAIVSLARQIDSLTAHEFAVELDGEPVTGVLRVTGFVSFKLDVKTTTSLKMMHEPFKIVRMVQRDPNLPFNRWIRETTSTKADIVRPKRVLTLIAVDNDTATRRWAVQGAWISEIGYSEFNTGSSELVEEVITIQHEGIEETWLTAAGA